MNFARAENYEWFTPDWVFNGLNTHFDLDPCSNGETPATEHFYDLGLMREWKGFVWCNPPYGRATGDWMQKMALHNNGIALVFARTDTRWFQDYCFGVASAFLWVKGRIKFVYQGKETQTNGGALSVLVGYGSQAQEVLKASGVKGYYSDQKV